MVGSPLGAVSCPNGASWLRGVFGSRWINLHVPFHVCHFEPDTLKGTIRAAGLRVLSLRQETPALWVAQSLIAWAFWRRGRATRQIRNPYLVGALMLVIRLGFFPLLWLGNVLGRGDCLKVVAAEKTGRGRVAWQAGAATQ